MNGRRVDIVSHVRSRTAGERFLSTGRIDLTAAILVALLLPFMELLPSGVIRVPVGLVAVLFLPGYVLTELVIPNRRVLRLAERLALSIGLSVSIIPIMTLLLSRVPGGITARSISAALSIWVIVTASAALWRRPAQRAHDRRVTPGRHGVSRYGLASVAVGLAILTVLWLPSFRGVPLDTIGRSEPPAFYVLGSEGQAQSYPRSVSFGELVTITVGIIHPLQDEGMYHVEVWLSDRADEQQELAVRQGPYTLATGSRMEVPVHWPMDKAGDDQKVRVLLFEAGEEEPMRELTLWIDVEEID